MIDPGLMMLMMYLLVVVMVIGMVMGLIKDNFKKKKKEVEVPRDTIERLTKAYKVMAKGGLNRRRVKHTLWISGDQYFQGYRLGDIIALQPLNEEYLVYTKYRWWYFWARAVPIILDVELVTDWNSREVVAEARGIEATTEGVYYLIPCYGVPKGKLERAYVQRFKNRMVRVLKQSILDADVDLDVIPKIALRGDISAAMSEIGRPEDMPSIGEDEVKRYQKRMVKDTYQGPPSGGAL